MTDIKYDEKEATLVLITGGTSDEQRQFIECWLHKKELMWQNYRFHFGPSQMPWPWSRLQTATDCSEYGLWKDGMTPVLTNDLQLPAGFQSQNRLHTCLMQGQTLYEHTLERLSQNRHLSAACLRSTQKFHILSEWTTLSELVYVMKHWKGTLITVRLVGTNRDPLPTPSLYMIATDWLIFSDKAMSMSEWEHLQPVYNSKYWLYIPKDK